MVTRPVALPAASEARAAFAQSATGKAGAQAHVLDGRQDPLGRRGRVELRHHPVVARRRPPPGSGPRRPRWPASGRLAHGLGPVDRSARDFRPVPRCVMLKTSGRSVARRDLVGRGRVGQQPPLPSNTSSSVVSQPMPWTKPPSIWPRSMAGLIERPTSCSRSARSDPVLAGQRIDQHLGHRRAVGVVVEGPAAGGPRGRSGSSGVR